MTVLSAALAAMAFGLGALCFQLAFDREQVGRNLAAEGVGTEAIVEELSPVLPTGRYPVQPAVPDYDVTYSFLDAAGQVWRFTTRMSFPVLPLPKAGDAIRVRYLPSNPRVNEVNRGSVASSAMLVLWIAVLSTGFGIAVLAYLLWHFALRRHLERLFQE